MILSLLLIGLTLIACASPALTLLHLWQLKEWRWDRLFEHLRQEGIWATLFSRTRGMIALAWLFIGFCLVFSRWITLDNEDVFLMAWPFVFFGLLSGLSVLQILLKRQPIPVWTQKAILLFAITMGMTFLIAFVSLTYTTIGYTKIGDQIEKHPYFWIAYLMPYAQWMILAMAWVLVLPTDRYLKSRIIKQAKKLRQSFPDLTVIGITGSVGKTTTKELIAHLLGDLHPLSTPVHVNSELGIARWLIQELSSLAPDTKDLRQKTEDSSVFRLPSSVLVVEMGAYRRGEIAFMSSYVRQTIGVLTYIGNQHLALFGSQENLLRAKAEILETLPKNGHAFINGDNDFSRKAAENCPCPVTVVSTGGSADLEATDIEETGTGIRFRTLQHTFDVPLHGTHNVTNALLGIAVARHLGISLEQIRLRMRTFKPLAGTFTVRKEHGITILDDTHNSSAASFKAAIAWAKSQPGKPKILVASGLIELGEERAKIEKELGILAADVFDEAYFPSKRAAQFFEQGFGRPVHVISEQITPLPSDSLLTCVGRMSQKVINRFLILNT